MPSIRLILYSVIETALNSLNPVLFNHGSPSPGQLVKAWPTRSRPSATRLQGEDLCHRPCTATFCGDFLTTLLKTMLCPQLALCKHGPVD